MEIVGILKMKSDTNKVSEKFTKRDFVLTDNSSQYPQHIAFQLSGDKTALMDKFNPGDEIKVTFNLRGREWTSPTGEVKYFNTLDAWKVEGLVAGSAPASTKPAANTAAKTNVAAPAANTNAIVSSESFSADVDDDLPF